MPTYKANLQQYSANVLKFALHARVMQALFTHRPCACRPGGLKKTPPSEVGNLVTGKEDTLFGLPTQRGKDISRDTVRTKYSSFDPHNAQFL